MTVTPRDGIDPRAEDLGARPSDDRPRVLAIVGPTAVGKTEVAIGVAQAVDGEVVSLDSRQLYIGMDIGTATPTPNERADVPHHLIDVTPPSKTLTLTEVQELARGAVDAIHGRDRVPILAGGTGQYVWAVLEGWQVPEVPPQPEFRARLREAAQDVGRAAIHARLAEVDPEAAQAIHPNNLRRVIRALEVHHVTGRPITELQGRRPPDWDVLIVGLTRSREVLYERIDRRIDAMLAAGLEDEVRRLVDSGHGFDAPAMSGLGYGEWAAYFAGEATREDVRTEIARNTRRLVRTQANWFSPDDPRIIWFDLEEPGTDEAVVAACRAFVSGSG